MNQYLNVPYSSKNNIHEIDFGDMTGHTNEYIREHFKENRVERLKMQADIPYPNGECGEDVVVRAFPVLLDIIDEMNDQGYKKAVIVTHGGVIRALTAHILGMSQADKLRISLDLENTSITEFLWSDQYQQFYLERLNDYSHLNNNPELLRSNWIS